MSNAVNSPMQGLRCLPLPTNGADPFPVLTTVKRLPSPLSIDAGDPPELRIERLITENPVVIFSRHACFMCHVMKRLLSKVGAHSIVIELDEAEELALAAAAGGVAGLPAMFIGGELVGGIEGMIGLHLGGGLVPRLREVGDCGGGESCKFSA